MSIEFCESFRFCLGLCGQSEFTEGAVAGQIWPFSPFWKTCLAVPAQAHRQDILKQAQDAGWMDSNARIRTLAMLLVQHRCTQHDSNLQENGGLLLLCELTTNDIMEHCMCLPSPLAEQSLWMVLRLDGVVYVVVMSWEDDTSIFCHIRY